MFIDVNCLIGSWPSRPSPLGTASALADHLRGELVDAALVSNVESLFVLDTSETNAALLQACESESLFHPAPILNLRVRNWSRLLRDYTAGGSPVRAIRIHPNYHFYDLSHPAVDELAAALEEANLPLVLSPRVFDERLHNPMMKVPGVPMREVVALATRHDRLKVLCVNAYRSEIAGAEAPRNLWFDIAFAEYFKSVSTLRQSVAADRLVFGSNAPIHSTRAAGMKVAWAEVPDDERTAVAATNAVELLGLR